MDDTQKVIEILLCAEIRCDNAKRLGPFFADAVKMQIQEAIIQLGGKPATPQVTP